MRAHESTEIVSAKYIDFTDHFGLVGAFRCELSAIYSTLSLILKNVPLRNFSPIILHHVFKSVAACPKSYDSRLKMLHSKYIQFIVYICNFLFL